jgi:non-ribosomal peptide synthetase component F
VRAVTLEAYAHQDAPFDRVVQAVAPARHGHAPLYQVALYMDPSTGDASDATFTQVTTQSATARFTLAKLDLMLVVQTRPDAIVIETCYDADLYRAATIERFASRFAAVIQQVIERPDLRIQAISLDTPAEVTTPPAASGRALLPA